MKLTLHIIALIMITGIFCSCSRFDEINTDPDKTTVVTPQLLATNLILETCSYPKIGKDFLYKDMLAKYISYMEGATSYQYNKIERAEFSSLIKLTNVAKMMDLSNGTVYENSYHALGHFVRAYTFYNLTMSVGDIPYTQALKAEEGIYYPEYAEQKEIFQGILNELEEANNLFSTGVDFPGDPVYNGSVSKWQKACNNLSLKILTHLWKKTTDTDLRVTERFNTIVALRPLMTSNQDNLQLSYSKPENENYPFFFSSFRNYPIMSSTIVERMKELKDYRLFYYAEPSEALINSGKTADQWDAYEGTDPSDDFSEISEKYSQKMISGINKRYYSLEEGEPTFLLSYAEQCFIISEGILRGWTTGDAQSYYEEGIRSAMSFTRDNTPDLLEFNHSMRITDAVIDEYLLESEVAFNGSNEKKLEKIFQQRYFIGFMQDGWNSFFEYRRTGFPELPVNEMTNLNQVKTQLPKRWMYPVKELSYNRTNVQNAINLQFAGNDDNNELIWILK